MIHFAKKYGQQLKGILMGVAFTPFAAFAAIVSAGGGHGNYTLAKILFPYSLFLTHVSGGIITQPLIALALVQFLLYGLAVSSFHAKRTAISILVAHSVCVCLCFAIPSPNVS
jgi:hypothetical protein